MANTIITKNSSTASDVPTAGQLSTGELAVNTNDEKIYSKNASTVFKIGMYPDEDEVISAEWSIPSIPRNKTVSYEMVLGDAGQTVRFTGSTASKICTIPEDSSVAYLIGTLICVINDGSVVMTLEIEGTDDLTWSKDNTTGTRTLAPGADLVIHKVIATGWKVNGSALVT